jgi:phenylacetic acid degradation protein
MCNCNGGFLTVYEFDGMRPAIGGSSFVHEKASVIGNVKIGEECFVGAGAVVRGDYGRIEIGDRTSVQENSVIHARPDDKCIVGNDVQIGHGAILHNCIVRDYAVIGLGSRVCDFATVGVWAIVGEGAVVSAQSQIPDDKVAVGIPARVLRDVTEEERNLWSGYKKKYAELATRYKTGLKPV